MFASTPSERSINETSVDAGEEGEDDSSVTEVSLKAPLSTLKRVDVSGESDGIRKIIVENSAVPVVGLMVKMGSLLMDTTFFFVPAAPETVNG